MKKPLLIAFLLKLLLTGSGFGNHVGQNLNHFFNNLGTSTNVTGGGAYKDQSAGYYTGGNLFARNTVQTSQLAAIRLPGYRAGCGGIDMHMGAMSFISSQELVKALRTIGSNMASYGLMLAIETMAPQVKNIMSELNDLAQKINQSNINSCEIAATTLGSILPKSDAANQHLCTMIGTDGKYSAFSDYAAARQGCGAGGKRDQVIAQGQEDERFKKILSREFNIAWQAIRENSFLISNQTLAEFFMTISGTIISAKGEQDYQVKTYASLVDQDSLLKAMLHGGQATVYTCKDKDKCLDLAKEPLTIASQESLVAKVKEVLSSIASKIHSDTPLTDSQKAFLNSTRLPFYKILNVNAAFRRGTAPSDINDFSELAAIDLLFQYVSEILDLVQESTNHLKAVQVDDSHIAKFQKALAQAKERVTARRHSTFAQVEQILSFIRKTELIEKTIAAKVSELGSAGL